MGMFDNISVADKLPISQEMIDAGFGENNMGYQTKCLHCCLDSYIIQGGRLFQVHFLGEAGGLGPPINHHGVINFYTSETKDNLRFWIEYDATFTHGKLDSIVLKEFRIEDDTERQNAIKKVFADAEARQKLWYNKYCFHTKAWQKVRNLITTGLYNLERFSQKVRLNLP